MAGVYRGGNRYDIHFEPLVDFSDAGAGDRAARVQAAVERYVGLLEQHCRRAPYNWFNFFDFWQDGEPTLPCTSQSASEVDA
jgi:predicted LPLAT superfamily acyltransferase